MPRLSDEQYAGIAAQRDDAHPTRRPVSAGLEDIMYTPFPVLDHGIIRVVDYMGGDAAIVQAARVSYGKGTETRTSDRGLIRYLLRNRHTSPFEMPRIELHLRMPLFVARQWVRHRTASMNEFSARYSIMSDTFYVPDLDAIAAQSSTNRQGRGAALPADQAVRVQAQIAQFSADAFALYESLLNENDDGTPADTERTGIARELARSVLPVNIYTEFYWSLDLHNLLHFLNLRTDEHAQYEIREYATIILNEIVSAWVPLTHEAFQDYRMHAREFSAQEINALRDILAHPDSEFDDLRAKYGITGRGEWRDFRHTLVPDSD